MKKLLNKKGNVMLLVLIIMSLLIVASCAAYYVVNNQHQSISQRYSSEQSYQTALSVSESVSSYIQKSLAAISESGNGIDDFTGNIVYKMKCLASGASINGTLEPDISQELQDKGLGDYSVTITRIDDGSQTDENGNTMNLYEVTTRAEVDGESSSIRQVWSMSFGPTEYFTRFLTSTGNRPEDVLITAHKIMSEAYFENEYTEFGNPSKMNSSIYVSGSFNDTGMQFDGDNDSEIVVAENYYVNTGVGSSIVCGNIYVGGDMVVTKEVTANKVYVLGDLTVNQTQKNTSTVYYVGGDCYINAETTGCTFYVTGNLYINYGNQGKFEVAGNVEIAEDFWLTSQGVTYGGTLTAQDLGEYNNWGNYGFAQGTVEPKSEELSNASIYISSSTTRQKYEKWDAEAYFNSANITREIILDNVNDEAVKVYDTNNEVLQNPEIYNQSYIVTISDSCILRPATTNWLNYGYHNILIDATQKDIYIKLEPQDGSDTFVFATSGCPVNVYVKGSYSVIFVLPDDFNFSLNPGSFVGHIDLATYLTGMTKEQLLTTNSIRANFATAEEAADLMDGKLTIDPVTGAEILNTSAIENTNGLHNNIFLVTTGTSNTLGNFLCENTFCGYVYAPNAILEATSNNNGGLGFVGGLIAGSYSYNNNSAVLAYTTPYDYNNVYGLSDLTDIVKHLMATANAAGGSAADTDSVIQSFSMLGYE